MSSSPFLLSDQNATEEELRAANRRLAALAEERARSQHEAVQLSQMLFEHTSDLALRVALPQPDAPIPILAANDAMSTLTGYPCAELVGMDARRLASEQSLALTEARLRMLLSQQYIRFEFEIVTAAGTKVPVRANASLIAGEPGQVVLLARPVHTSGPALGGSRGVSGRLVYEVLLATGEVHLSGPAHAELNLDHHAAHGFTISRWLQRIHPEDRARVEVTWQQAVQALGEYQIRYRYEWSPGFYRMLEDLGMILADEAGQADRAIGTLRDISPFTSETAGKERRQAQEQSNRLESLGVLTSGIAHDFNNILAAIIGLTDLSVSELPEDSEVHDDLKQALQAAHRAKELVRQILSFSRHSGEERLPLYLHLVVREALRLLRASLPAQVRLVDSVNVHSGVILANAGQMHQVVMNFCTNAAQALPAEGGTIEVRVEDVEVGAELALQHVKLRPGPHVLLSISDTGGGMPPEVLAQAFQPFFTTRKPGEGTGMGLALVERIVSAHGGAILVDSRVGAGTTFRAYFPRAAQEAAGETARRSALPRGSGRVLFVDDEVTVRKFAEKALPRLGYQVTLCADGDRALDVFRSRPQDFDILVTDQIMPKMSGDHLAEQVHHLRPDLPIILFTGYSHELTLERLQAAGISQILIKPVAMGELGESLHRALGQKQKGAEAKSAAAPLKSE